MATKKDSAENATAENATAEDAAAEISKEALDMQRMLLAEDDAEDPVARIERTYQIWWHWANIEIFIVSPTIPGIYPPVIIPPEPIPGSNELEFVYPIHDSGFSLTASKAENMYSAGMSNCKLHYTVEKMVALLVERLKTGGVSTETEVQVALSGHELALRKVFEVIINLSYNVVVTNFDPGAWGERYLLSVKRLADTGYGYPPEAPRETYRKAHSNTSKSTRRGA